MAFVVKARRHGDTVLESFASRRDATAHCEALWRDWRSEPDWTVAVYECPHLSDLDAAIARVQAGGGLILAHRDRRADDKAGQAPQWILDRKP
ncbi:hypothetical protein [Aurantimonas sp. 22II-16-19i]|uniref:hypothetical protein n=1 Tax=Aurantimonas sp. 22II-16-19i TaxID=1317114 RepID=UPI0009F7ECD2|nr:hypothetical protein [Aurantimonas sp. 22II-16-19i]ORE85620.1 hypothetical protein ATO4_26427 [Aurantimonas sp. 22II-16-19i]